MGHTRRGVILARGLGTRMRAVDSDAVLSDAQRRAADTGLKAMMPIHGRPFLDYVLSVIADAGIDRVALVVAPDHDTLKQYYDANAHRARVRVSFVVQPEPIGTADAVRVAEAWTAGEPFLAMNADNLYPVAALTELAELDEPGLPGFDANDLVRTSNIPPERIASFAFIETDANGYLKSIIEKPGLASARSAPSAPSYSSPPSYSSLPSLISMNVWRFDARIFDACASVPRSARGEFELPEAVAFAVTRGLRFRVVPAHGPVLDLSRRSDAADVERRLNGEVPRP